MSISSLKLHWLVPVITVLACTTSAQPTLTPAPAPNRPPAVVKGVAISPQGFPADFNQFADFCAEVQAMPDGGVLWNGSWQEGARSAGLIPPAASATIECAGQATPLLVFGWRSGSTLYLSVPGRTTNNWGNTGTRQLYEQTVSSFASFYKPPYIFLGNENDFYYEQDPADYKNWIAAYSIAYDAIKAVSPDTQVGPVFNFEHLAATGRLNQWTTPYWEALTLHELKRVDIVGLTLYPFLAVPKAADLPDDYLDPLIERISDKPIAITETGWPADPPGNLPTEWETGEAAQVTYLSQLSQLLNGKNVRVVNWLYLYPMADAGSLPVQTQLFSSISLKDAAGKERPVYEAWLNFKP